MLSLSKRFWTLSAWRGQDDLDLFTRALPHADERLPWWSPPERQSARNSNMLGLLCGLAFVVGTRF